MSQHVLVSQAGGVCELRFNRPDKRNAITVEMYDALSDALTRVESDDSIRVTLLSGAGASFTAGNDLNDFMSAGELNESAGAVRFLRLLPTLRKMLIAAVHGPTVGIGVTLLLHCDLVLAAQGARLTMPFVRLGLVPEAASSLLLPRLIGHQRAAELLLLGEPIDAARALNLGLVNRVVEEGKLLEEARALARTVAEQPAGAVRATKALLRSDTVSVTGRVEEELSAFREQLQGPEFRQAVQAFLDKGRR